MIRLATAKDRHDRIAFHEICAIDPRVALLYRKAQAVKDPGVTPWFCANAVWDGYGGRPGFKHRLSELVGFDAEREALATSEAYDVAYQTIYDALPPCRGGCGCA